jgi:hypothetical protein
LRSTSFQLIQLESSGVIESKWTASYTARVKWACQGSAGRLARPAEPWHRLTFCQGCAEQLARFSRTLAGRQHEEIRSHVSSQLDLRPQLISQLVAGGSQASVDLTARLAPAAGCSTWIS